MAPLHYATFFDVAPVLTTLLHHTKVSEVVGFKTQITNVYLPWLKMCNCIHSLVYHS